MPDARLTGACKALLIERIRWLMGRARCLKKHFSPWLDGVGVTGCVGSKGFNYWNHGMVCSPLLDVDL